MIDPIREGSELDIQINGRDYAVKVLGIGRSESGNTIVCWRYYTDAGVLGGHASSGLSRFREYLLASAGKDK